MTRRCDLTGKNVASGNNVSHANNKTKRKFIPNLQKASLYSEEIGKMLKFKVAVSSLRTVEKKGGIDDFLLNANEADLSLKAQKYKRVITSSRKKKTITK